MENNKLKFKNMLIWIGFCISLSFLQFFMLGLGAMATDAGTPKPSWFGTITSIPFALIVATPSLVPLIFSFKMYKKKTQFLLIPIISLIITLFIMDMSMGFFGGYSITDGIFKIQIAKKEDYVSKNHPKHNPENVLIGDINYYTLYLDGSTSDVILVKPTSIKRIKNWATRPDDIPFIKLKINDITINLIQLYKWDSSVEKVVQTTRFSIASTGRTYELDEGIDLEDFINDVEFIDPIILKKDGNVISLEEKNFIEILNTDEVFNNDANSNRFSWVFIKDGKEVLSRASRDFNIDISVVPTVPISQEMQEYYDMIKEKTGRDVFEEAKRNNLLVQKGKWEVYIEAFSTLFDDYVRVSDVLEYEI